MPGFHGLAQAMPAFSMETMNQISVSKNLVTSLVVVTLAAGSVSGMEVGPSGSGLSIGGWGEAFARGEHREAFNRNNSKAGTPAAATENAVDFSSQAMFKMSYRVDDFSMRADVLFFDQQTYGSNVLLEQAYLDWRTSDWATVRAGRFQTTWIGWEGYHTAELWRVNNSAVWSWNIQDHGQLKKRPFLSDGLDVKLTAPSAPVTLDLLIVDDVLGDGPSTTSADKAFGASLAWRPADIGRIELGAVLDPHAMNNGDGTSSTGAAVDLNIDITGLLDHGWFFAGEVQVHEHGDLAPAGSRFGEAVMLLGMANYAFTDKISVTAMIDWVDRGRALRDNEIVEYALAVLTRPGGQARLNAEVFYWDESADQADAIGAAAVLQLSLP